jgi:hypothetical protein
VSSVLVSDSLEFRCVYFFKYCILIGTVGRILEYECKD